MGKAKVDAKKIDVLREVANIGVGNAAVSLSTMLNDQKVHMEVPQVSLVPLEVIPHQLGGEEETVTAIYINVTTAVDLVLLFTLSLPSALSLVKLLLPEGLDAEEEMARSALLEIGNIITGAFLNAISSLTGMPLLPNPPGMAVDMAGAILGTVLGEAAIADDLIILLKTDISVAETMIEGSLLIFPEPEALDTLFSMLGVS